MIFIKNDEKNPFRNLKILVPVTTAQHFLAQHFQNDQKIKNLAHSESCKW
jgi:hypothetical protein